MKIEHSEFLLQFLKSAQSQTLHWHTKQIITIAEEDIIGFEWQSPIDCQPILWLADIAKPPSEKILITPKKWCYRWWPDYQQAFFLNYFGICPLSLAIKQQYFPLAELNIVSKKISPQRLQALVNYIISREQQSIANFSPSYILGLQSISIGAKLKQIEQQLQWLTTHFANLIASPLSKFTTVVQKQTTHHHTMVRQQHGQWLLQHLDQIKLASNAQPQLFRLGLKNYYCSQLPQQQLVATTDIYENQVIYGYLTKLQQTLLDIQQQCQALKSPTYTSKTSYISFFQQISDHSLALCQSRYQYCQNLLAQLNRIIASFKRKIIVSKIDPHRPKLTPLFKNAINYQTLFCQMLDFYQLNQNYDEYQQLLALRSLDKLYEYYCWHQLQQSFITLGFTIVEQQSKQIVYKKPTMTLKLWYQPVFSNNTELTAINAWNRAGHTLKHARQSPDFVLKIQIPSQTRTQNKSHYLIFDAKYQTAINCRQQLANLVLNYIYGVNITQQIRALYLFHPQDKNTKAIDSFYQADYNLFSASMKLPSLGLIEVDPQARISLAAVLGLLINSCDDYHDHS